MHAITSAGSWELVIKLRWDLNRDGTPDSRQGTWGEGRWANFKIGSEGDGYRLTIGQRTSFKNMDDYDPFNSGNSRNRLDQMKFTTKDVDNDKWKKTGGNCADQRGGAWWFNACTYACLNCVRTAEDSRYIWYDGTHKRFPAESQMYIKRA